MLALEGEDVARTEAGMTEKCTRRAVQNEVMRAAEEPSPVLATSGRRTLVGLNGGNCASEDSVGGRLRA